MPQQTPNADKTPASLKPVLPGRKLCMLLNSLIFVSAAGYMLNVAAAVEASYTFIPLLLFLPLCMPAALCGLAAFFNRAGSGFVVSILTLFVGALYANYEGLQLTLPLWILTLGLCNTLYFFCVLRLRQRPAAPRP